MKLNFGNRDQNPANSAPTAPTLEPTQPPAAPAATAAPANPFSAVAGSRNPALPKQTSREAKAAALLAATSSNPDGTMTIGDNEATPTINDSSLDQAITRFNEENPIPDNPTPANLLTRNLDLLELTYSHLTLGRNTLAEIHSILKENPDLGELLTPQSLGSITRAMESLTAGARKKAARNTASSEKRKQTRASGQSRSNTAKPKSAEATDLANFASDLGLEL